ncbi:MAG TPA: tripartite tricarboxylate transporter substrate binding protein [Xanthobacteraceae bacterium]|jgi:tripartite-type tricarboxylate transporter receptor subunit TctC
MRVLLFILAICAAFDTARAEEWPGRPIKLIVPYSAGGSGDIVAREVAQKLSMSLGQSVVVENRPGASGNIGTAAVAKSPPDGHTILMASDIQVAINPNFWSDLPYQLNEFEPISLVATVDLVLTATPSLDVADLRRLVQKAKQQPGAINYGSTGPGSTHELAMELLQQLGGFKLTEVPYRGSAQALPDLLSGQLQLMLMGIPQSLSYLRAGQLKALAVGSPERLPSLPDVATISQQGFPGFEANNYWCLYAPAGTPKDIVSKLGGATAQVLAQADLRDHFLANGLTPVGSTPEALAARVAADSAKWKKVIATLPVHAGK